MPSQLALDWNAVDPSVLVVAPSVYPQALETSAIAAVANAKDRATQNDRILRLVTAAGAAGMSDHELHVTTGYSRATICARRGFDLAPFLVPGTRRATSPAGRPMTTWVRRPVEVTP